MTNKRGGHHKESEENIVVNKFSPLLPKRSQNRIGPNLFLCVVFFFIFALEALILNNGLSIEISSSYNLTQRIGEEKPSTSMVANVFDAIASLFGSSKEVELVVEGQVTEDQEEVVSELDIEPNSVRLNHTYATTSTTTTDRTLYIGANTNISGNLNVEGEAEFKNNIDVEGRVNSYSANFNRASVQDTLSVAGETTIGTNMYVGGNLTTIGQLTSSGLLSSLGGLNTGGADIDAGEGNVYAANLVNLIESIVAGRNVTIDYTDPKNPIINARRSSGGGDTTIIGGEGNVTAGEIGQIAYYAADGDTVVGTSSITIGSDGMVTIAGSASTTDLYVSGGLFLETLADCDTEPLDVLLYDSTTGRFICGTDDTGASVGIVDIFEGSTEILANAVSIAFNENQFDITASGTQAVVELDYINSGLLQSSTSATISAEWVFLATTTFAFASTSDLYTNTFYQNGLGDCSGEGQTILYDATTGLFFCGVDAGSGVGIWSESGDLVYLTDPDQDVLIGGTATTTDATLEVNGLIAAANFIATSTEVSSFAGWVGIGTTTPASALDVNGVITATGGDSTDWNTAFSWGDHAAAGYLTASTFGDDINVIELAAEDFGDFSCNGVTCLLDNTYLTQNDNITLSGAVTGSGTSSIVTTLASNIVATGNIVDDTILAEDLDTTNSANDGDFLSYNAASGDFTWIDAASAGLGDITEVIAGDGLSGGGTIGAVSLSLDLLSGADSIGSVFSYSGLELAGTSTDQLTLLQGCSDEEILAWSEGNSRWECTSIVGGITGVGDISGVTAGTGLTGGGSSGDVTLGVDGVLEDLDTLGAPTEANQFITSSGAGVFQYLSTSSIRALLDLEAGIDFYSMVDADTTFLSIADFLATSTLASTPGSSSGDILIWDGGEWVANATTSLGIGGTGVTNFVSLTDVDISSLTANRVLFASSSGSSITDNANFVFDGTNLGLGTSTPNHLLTVHGDMSLVGSLFDSTNASGTSGQLLQSTGSGVEWISAASLGLGGAFETSGGYTTLVNIGDNVGIGTTTPSHKLTVDGLSLFADDVSIKGQLAISSGATTSSSITETTDTHFDAGSHNQTVRDGESDDAVVEIDIDFSSNNWTHISNNWLPAIVGAYANPAFADIDNDGDFDLVVGDGTGYVEYFKNDGTVYSPSWIQVSSDWLGVDVGSRAAPAFADIDNDGDFDLAVGDYDGFVEYFRNDGDASSPSWTHVSSDWLGFDVGFRAAPAFADIDNDGDFDLAVGDYDGYLEYFRNDGDASSPSWTHVSNNWLPVDVGDAAVPVFADLDNDDDFDLAVGDVDGYLEYFRNDGDVSSPSWTHISSDWLGADVGITAAPAFADMNNDGYFDLAVGDGSGFVEFFLADIVYYSNATYTSQIIDANYNDLKPTVLSWTETLPANTDITIQLRSASTSAGLSGATWYGPTGTGDSYITSGGETINSVHEGDKYIQYKVVLSGDTIDTPILSDITIEFDYVASFLVDNEGELQLGNGLDVMNRFNVNNTGIISVLSNGATSILFHPYGDSYILNNFGLGTDSPTHLLSVNGDLGLVGAFYDSLDSAGTNGQLLQTTGTSTRWVNTSSLGLGGAFESSEGYATLVNIGDNVGIGTTTPSHKLTVDGLALFTGTGTSTFKDNLHVWGNLRVGTSSLLLSDASIKSLSGDLVLQPDNGGVSIGALSSTARLSIQGTDSQDNLLVLATSTGTTTLSVSQNGALELYQINPTELGQYDDGGEAFDIHVSGNYAYVADGYDGLEIINISNPANPVEVGQFVDGGYTHSVYVSGNYAYVADYDEGLKIINISKPTTPVKVGSYYDGGNAWGVYVSGNYAYVADTTDGLEIINISNPTNPVEVGQYDDGGSSEGVYISGNYAYVADYEDGLEIINISNPTNPVEVGQFDDGGNVHNVYVSGNYVYVADYTDGLEIIDVSSSTNPVEVGQYDDGGGSEGIYISGNYAYVTNDVGGLIIIDISSSTNPVLVGQYDDGGDAYNAYVQGNYVYVADGTDGLEILDIGGITSVSAEIGTLLANNIQSDVITTESAYIDTGLNVGQNALINGVLAITGNASTTLTTNSSLLTLGGSSLRDVYLSFKSTNSSTSVDTWSIGLDQTNDAFRISSSTSLGTNDYFSILGNGKVGIGTTTPTHQLSISGDMGLTGAFFDTNSASGTSGQILQSTGSGVVWADLILNYGFTSENGTTSLLNIDDYVGIGTTSPLFKLTVAGTIGPDADDLYNLGAAGSDWGCLYYNGGTLGTCASDERLKENIEILTFDVGSTTALDKLAELELNTFNYISAPNSEYKGLIAQDVLKVAPELVAEDEEGYLQVRYGDVQWLVFEAVQELWRKVKEFANWIISRNVVAEDYLCVGDTCVDEDGLKALLLESGVESKTVNEIGDIENSFTSDENDFEEEFEETGSTVEQNYESTDDISTTTESIVVDDSNATSTGELVEDESVVNDIGTSTEEVMDDNATSSDEIIEEESIVEEQVAGEESIVEEQGSVDEENTNFVEQVEESQDDSETKEEVTEPEPESTGEEEPAVEEESELVQ